MQPSSPSAKLSTADDKGNTNAKPGELKVGESSGERCHKSKMSELKKLKGSKPLALSTTTNKRAAGQEYCFANMPNFFIRERRVVRFIPRRAAAPSAPPTRPLHAVSACMISLCCFLAYSSATLVLTLRESVLSSGTSLSSCKRSGESTLLVFRSSARGASSERPLVKRTARSMKFSSSRILPGQSQVVSPFITDTGTVSIRFCISLAQFWTK